jgi:hypothetical protein
MFNLIVLNLRSFKCILFGTILAPLNLNTNIVYNVTYYNNYKI